MNTKHCKKCIEIEKLEIGSRLVNYLKRITRRARCRRSTVPENRSPPTPARAQGLHTLVGKIVGIIYNKRLAFYEPLQKRPN